MQEEVLDKNGKKFLFRKITRNEFDKLYQLFPDSDELWQKYRSERLKQFDEKDIDVYVIECEEKFVGEVSVNYSSHALENEAIPNQRVYFEAFRLDQNYQGLGLGQALMKYALTDLENRGYTEFTIGVEEENEVAKHIYFKFGFIEAIGQGYGDEFDPSPYTLYLKRTQKKSH